MSIEDDLKIAALLREAGANVDEAVYWANRLRVSARVIADKKLAAAVVLSLLGEAFIPEAKRQPLVKKIMKVMGR
jgi:hypothetical protein